jgi:hypothetical protein
MSDVVFYVSGHGYGHAVRTAEVIRSLLELSPTCRASVRTIAPKELFAANPGEAVRVQHTQLDTGVVEENGTLAVNAQATVEQLASFLRDRQRILDAEIAFLRHDRPALLVADIPYLAGDVAEAVGIPCVGIGNFTWDWIYEPYLAGYDGAEGLIECIRQGYAKMHSYLKLPFSHDVNMFRLVMDVPLITRHPRRSPEEVLRELGVDAHDSRPRVMVAMRGRILPAALEAAAKRGKDFLFLHIEEDHSDLPENTRQVVFGPNLRFTDVLNVCDILVSKLGYGMLAECVACQTAILFPPRIGFREDEILRSAASLTVKAREIPLADFEAGDWLAHLRRLKNSSVRIVPMDTDGAKVCAQIIVGHLERSPDSPRRLR